MWFFASVDQCCDSREVDIASISPSGPATFAKRKQRTIHRLNDRRNSIGVVCPLAARPDRRFEFIGCDNGECYYIKQNDEQGSQV